MALIRDEVNEQRVTVAIADFFTAATLLLDTARRLAEQAYEQNKKPNRFSGTRANTPTRDDIPT